MAMTGESSPPRTAAVIVAAGQGLRAGQPLPKQFAQWRGKPVIRHSVEAMVRAGISPIVAVIPEGADEFAQAALAGIGDVIFVTGGETRQESVRKGLEVLEAPGPDLVLIHDAARPGLGLAVIERLTKALDIHLAAIPVLPVIDSMIGADANMMAAPIAREGLAEGHVHRGER